MATDDSGFVYSPSLKLDMTEVESERLEAFTHRK